MRTSIHLSLGLAAGLLCCGPRARAADAVEPAAAAAPPPPSCVAPKIVARMSMPREDVAHLQSLVNAYGECMKKYIDAREAASKAEVDAGNEAARQVNEVYAALRAMLAAQPK